MSLTKRKIIVRKKDKVINIFYPCRCSENYLHFEVLYIDSNSINMHQWRVFYLSVTDKNFNRLYTFKEVEWEGAILEVGASDFIGGYHGDENGTGISVFADNMLYPIETDFEFECQYLKLAITSVLNRCDTPGDDIFNRIKILEWGDHGYSISNRYELLQDFKIDRFESMMMGFGMFYGENRFLTHVASNTNPIPYRLIEDDVEKNLTNPLFIGDHDATSFEFFAPERNFYAKIQGIFDNDKYPNGYRRFDTWYIKTHKVLKGYFNMTGRYDGKKGEVFNSKSVITIEA